MTDTSSLIHLIERLEKATGPDRELDGEIASVLALHPKYWQRGVKSASADGLWFKGLHNWRAPDYTSSIDAAMTLVPEGMVCGFSGPTRKSSGVGHEGMFFGTCGSFPDDGFHIAVIATTPAVALCIAALKAQAATRDGAD